MHVEIHWSATSLRVFITFNNVGVSEGYGQWSKCHVKIQCSLLTRTLEKMPVKLSWCTRVVHSCGSLALQMMREDVKPGESWEKSEWWGCVMCGLFVCLYRTSLDWINNTYSLCHCLPDFRKIQPRPIHVQISATHSHPWPKFGPFFPLVAPPSHTQFPRETQPLLY